MSSAASAFRLEIAAYNQAQHWGRLRVETRLHFEERAVSILESHQDVESGFVVEVAERDIALLAGLRLEALVDEVQSWTCNYVG